MYEMDYDIRKDGSILSLKPKPFGGRLMKLKKDKDGYLLVNLCLNGVKRTEKVHRLVAQKFLPNPLNLLEVNHKDGNKENNNDWNLEWCNSSYNQKHAYATGLMKSRKGTFNKPRFMLSQFDLNGNKVNVFGSIAEAERLTGIHNSCISMCVNHKYNTAGGYKWTIKQAYDTK